MADPSLHGNGRPCDNCGGTGAIRSEIRLSCPKCRGIGRLALSDPEIIDKTLTEARAVYWPLMDHEREANQ